MEKFWHHQARRVAARVNVARWLEFAIPAAAVICFAAGCALLVVRRNGWSVLPVTEAAAGVALVVAIVAGYRTRRTWFSATDGLVRLEAELRLCNRLSSAAAGVGRWPEPVVRIDDGYRWHWQRIAGPLAIGACFLAASALIPISRDFGAGRAPTEAPLAWTQVQNALDELKRDQVATPESLAALEQKLDALRAKPAESWYTQSSLEAGDALRQDAANAFATMEKNLDSAAQTLDSQFKEDATGAPMQPGDRAEAKAQLEQALHDLESGKLALNKADAAALKALVDKLGQSGNQSLSQLSQEQLRKMQQQLSNKLKQCSGSCQSALGTVGEALAKAGNGAPAKCLATGAGGPGGGGGPAPLGLKETPTNAGAQNSQAVAGKDMEHAALGDVLKVVTGEHKADPNAGKNPQAAGAVSSPGSGGETVWKNELSPAEQEVLRRFFK